MSPSPNPFKPGDTVHVMAGPFAGKTGTVTTAADPAVVAIIHYWRTSGFPDPPAGAVWVLVDVFGHATPVAFAADELEPA